MSRSSKIMKHKITFEKQKNTGWSKFLEPKGLRHALTPLHITCMILGIEGIQMPLGRQRLVLSRAYAIILVVMSAMSVKTALEYFFGKIVTNITITENYGYYLLVCGHIVVTMLHVSMTSCHDKNLSKVFNDIVDIDEALHWLGMPCDHKRIFTKLLLRIGSIVSILLSIFIVEEIVVDLKFEKMMDHFWLSFAYHYTITVHIMVDVYFVSKCWLLTGLFAKMNLKLKGLQISYIDEFALNLPKFELSGKLPKLPGKLTLDVEEKIFVIDTIRMLHRRNRCLTKRFSDIFWTKNMVGATLCFVLVTMNLFSIYRLLSIQFSNVPLIVARILWIFVWLGKLFLTIRSRMMLDKEERETEEILLRFDEEHPKVKREIQAFSVELMQSWSSSSTNRQVNFDYAFFKQFLTNIMTYFVILVQEGSLS